MRKTTRFIAGILALVFLQIIFLGVYINVHKDLNNPGNIQPGYKYSNEKIHLKKPIEKSEQNDIPAYVNWKIQKEHLTKNTQVNIKKLDRNVKIPWAISLESRFKPTKFSPFVKVEEINEHVGENAQLSKKMSTKDLVALFTKPLRATQAITAKVISTKRTITRTSTSKKRETKQELTRELLVSFTTLKPTTRQAQRRHKDFLKHKSTIGTLPLPAISYPRNTDQSITFVVTKKPETYKTVLLYTSTLGRVPWSYLWFEEGMFFRENDGSMCPHKCRITYMTSKMKYSHAVVFQANDIREDLKKVAKHGRTFDQRWIYMTLENPFHSAHSSSYDGLFNWTSTYMRESEVHMPYNNYKRITSNEIPKGHFTRNYAEGKEKLIAWAVSHCGTKRDQIVTKLLKYVDVTVFGTCSSGFHQNNQYKCPRGSEKCRKILRKYKFYLSFENGLCSDYVTEKYWETPLDDEMVPVVFGANYDDKNSIPGSYINILDFPSIESLAKYLKYLDRNDTAYNEYFKWKSKYKVENHSWRCMLCANLYNDTLPRKVINNFSQFWSPTARCHDRELQAKVDKFLEA